MQVVTTKSELKSALATRTQGGRIVLVPTMGALHIGHFTLMDQARTLAGDFGTVVASVFVNPIQFNNQQDLVTYPRTFEEDCAGAKAHGVDILFAPEASEMYAQDRSINITEDLLSTTLCGASRPGHFSGVCTVLTKLFNLVRPTDAIFGKKDYQQLAIIRRLVRDLDIPVQIHGAEIVRQKDGLANASRNARLTENQKKEATILYKALQAAKATFKAGEKNPASLEAIARGMIESSPSHPVVDYITLVSQETMQPTTTMDIPTVMALAVSFGDVRLIDNLEF